MADLDKTSVASVNDQSVEESSSSSFTKVSLKVLSGTELKTFQIKDETTVGCSSPSQLIIPAPSLSKEHAKITMNNGRYFISDLDSTNKTFQNKVQLDPNVAYPLKNGDQIQFGDVICLFEEDRTSDKDIQPSSVSQLEENSEKKVESENRSDGNKVDLDSKSTNSDENLQKIEESSPRPSSEQLDVVPVSTLVDRLKQIDNDNDDLSGKEQIEVTIDPQCSETILKETSTVIEHSETKPIQSEVPTASSETAPPAEQVEPSEQKQEETEVVSQGETFKEKKESDSRRSGRRTKLAGGVVGKVRHLPVRTTRSRRTTAGPSTTDELDQTLEETIVTEDEDLPKAEISSTKDDRMSTTRKTPSKSVEKKNKPEPEETQTSETQSQEKVRSSARIRERRSNGQTRRFPFDDNYVNFDEQEPKSRAKSLTPKKTTRESRSSSPKKLARQESIEPKSKSAKKKKFDVYEEMDRVPETNLPELNLANRKRKTLSPPANNSSKKTNRSQRRFTEAPTNRNPRKTNESSTSPVRPTRRTIAASTIKETSLEEEPKADKRKKSIKQDNEEHKTEDRPVRIALSSHLEFNSTHLDHLRQLGFQIMDESSPVDALIVDKIRRTKKFFMCLARGAHILSPKWIESMINQNRYLPFDEFYLEDTNAETRYGFQLRQSVKLAKQNAIFKRYKFFCSKDTSPPYEDLKDIIEAAGGQVVDKINFNRPAKDLICIVAQTHKLEYESLFNKFVPIVSEEFVLTGISKQKVDFDSFSLFQSVAQGKTAESK